MDCHFSAMKLLSSTLSSSVHSPSKQYPSLILMNDLFLHSTTLKSYAIIANLDRELCRLVAAVFLPSSVLFPATRSTMTMIPLLLIALACYTQHLTVAFTPSTLRGIKHSSSLRCIVRRQQSYAPLETTSLYMVSMQIYKSSASFLYSPSLCRGTDYSRWSR
jgi:hypothetical protein